MNIQERLREKLYPYVTQCKQYKKSLGVLFVLGNRWEQHSFRATMQPVFVIGGLISLTTKWLSGSVQLHTSWWLIAVAIGAMLVGIAAGVLIAPRVSKSHSRALALVLAFVGATTVLIKGIISVSTGA